MVNIKNNLKSHLLRTAIWQQPASVQLHASRVNHTWANINFPSAFPSMASW